LDLLEQVAVPAKGYGNIVADVVAEIVEDDGAISWPIPSVLKRSGRKRPTKAFEYCSKPAWPMPGFLFKKRSNSTWADVGWRLPLPV